MALAQAHENKGEYREALAIWNKLVVSTATGYICVNIAQKIMYVVDEESTFNK